MYVHVMSLIMFNLSVLMHAAGANEYMLLRLGAVSKAANEETGKISLQVMKAPCPRKRHQRHLCCSAAQQVTVCANQGCQTTAKSPKSSCG